MLTRGYTKIYLEENQLSLCSIGILPLTTSPPMSFHRQRVRTSSLLSEGFVLTISVGDQDRFRRRDEVAPVADHLIERGPLENRSRAFVNGEQVGKEVLLLARG